MYDVITEDYLAADSTLLLVRRCSGNFTIPHEISPGHPITRIGKGAFSAFKSLNSVEIPDGITYVGDDNFLWCSALSQIYIPTSVVTWKDRWPRINENRRPECCLTMSKAEYSRLLSASVAASSGEYLIKDPGIFPIIPQLIDALQYTAPAVLPEGVPMLFLNTKEQDNDLFRTRDCLRFDGLGKRLSEDEAFRLLLRRGTSCPQNPDVELFDDSCLSRGENLPYWPVALAAFFPECVSIRSPGRWAVPLIFYRNTCFWQSAVRVCCSGRQYFIYRRNYLTSDAKLPYHRQDMAVYDENGLVTSRTLSVKVYEKYRLSFSF